MVMRRLTAPIALLTLSLTVGFLAAWAQPYPQQAQQGFPQQGAQAQGQDDPADAAEHGVGRLSLINGSVSLSRGDAGESIPASMNEPLVTTDRVMTGAASRAEIQFDPGSMIRLAANTEVRMGDLQYHRYLVQISEGTTLFRVLQDTDARIEISTPSVSVAPLRAGIYRVTVRPDGSSEITVRAGEAELRSPAGSERLAAGQTMFSRGPVDNPEFRSAAAIPYDEWDRWNADRDRFFERAPEVSRYAGPDIEGAQELANYGRWVWDPQYGYVWVPGNEPPDWAPYRDGHWDDVDYYGWSWVGNEPWGWAPYHYGNWYRASFGWAWYPGAIGPRHYWRPALVGFFGYGSPGFGVSLGFGYGNVGWVPLAPFERYRPWYGRGFNGGRNVTIANNTNITNVYRNARFSGAVTGLRAGDFGRVGVGRNAFVRPNSADLARAGVVSGGTPFAPPRNAAARSFGAAGATRFNNLRSNVRSGNDRSGNVGRLDGPSNNGGWRRLESQPGAPAAGGNRSGVRTFSPQRSTPQPVRISPQIVNNRYAPSPQGREFGGFGNFGGARPGGFGAPPPQHGAPAYGPPRGNPGYNRAPQGGAGGGYRGAPSFGGGTPRGGGGGGAPHGGGGPHGGGHGR
jgi:ferric-dicitrate binding protein FerR (iron transport regulator)